jgi:integrase
MSDFQWIFDKAETLSINRKQMVAQTTARDGSVRSISRGSMPKRFTVKLPDGLPWKDIKDLIAAAEALDRITPASINIGTANTAGFGWYYGTALVPSNTATYTVKCIEFPEWTIQQRSVSWSGPFVFVEVV